MKSPKKAFEIAKQALDDVVLGPSKSISSNDTSRMVADMMQQLIYKLIYDMIFWIKEETRVQQKEGEGRTETRYVLNARK